MPLARLAADLAHEPNMTDFHALLDALDHVVDGQGRDARCHERLHLHSGRPHRGCLGTDAQGGGGPIRRDRDDEVGQRQRVAERDEVGRSLAAHDAGELRDRQHVALGAAAVDDEAQGLLAADDLRLGDRAARRGQLRGDVHHPRPPAAIHVSQPAATRPGLRSLVHATSVPEPARLCARRQGRSSHQSSTPAPAGRLATDSGTTARPSAAASAESWWLSWPPARATRTRPAASRTGAPVAGSRSAATRRKVRRPIDFVTTSSRTAASTGRNSAACVRPARRRSAGRTNTSKVTKTDTGLPGSPKRSTGGPGRCSPRGAVPNANGLPGWIAARQRSTVPTCANAPRTTSYGPTETPPLTMTRSASTIADRRSSNVGSSRSGAMPRWRASAPAAAQSATSAGPFESGMPAGRA